MENRLEILFKNRLFL